MVSNALIYERVKYVLKDSSDQSKITHRKPKESKKQSSKTKQGRIINKAFSSPKQNQKIYHFVESDITRLIKALCLYAGGEEESIFIHLEV